MKAIIFSFQTY